MRINKGAVSEWSVLKEGDALIDIERTPDNYELVSYHEVLNPSYFSKKSVEWNGFWIACRNKSQNLVDIRRFYAYNIIMVNYGVN